MAAKTPSNGSFLAVKIPGLCVRALPEYCPRSGDWNRRPPPQLRLSDPHYGVVGRANTLLKLIGH